MNSGIVAEMKVGLKKSYLRRGLQGWVETDIGVCALGIVPPQGGNPRQYVLVYRNLPLPCGTEEAELFGIPHREVVKRWENGSESKLGADARAAERHLIYGNATVVQVAREFYER